MSDKPIYIARIIFFLERHLNTDLESVLTLLREALKEVSIEKLEKLSNEIDFYKD